MHFAQLPGENHSRNNGGDGSQERKGSGCYQCNYCYPLTFRALAFVALAAAAIGVYRIRYRIRTSLVDVAIFFVGIVSFLSISALIGCRPLYAILQ